MKQQNSGSKSDLPLFGYGYQKCMFLLNPWLNTQVFPVVFTVECGVVNTYLRHDPISLKHVSLWRLFLILSEAHTNRITPAYLTQVWQEFKLLSQGGIYTTRVSKKVSEMVMVMVLGFKSSKLLKWWWSLTRGGFSHKSEGSSKGELDCSIKVKWKSSKSRNLKEASTRRS